MKEPVEWWFVQGVFSGAEAGERHFLASLFRYLISGEGEPPEHGFSLLVSVLDPEGRQHSRARAEKRLVDWVADRIDDYREANVEPALIDIYQRETRRYGPPRPLELTKGVASFTHRPFSVSLDEYSFSQTESDFELRFTEPESGRECRFSLVPKVPVKNIRLQRDDGAPVETVCRTYPVLELSGTAGGEPVSGEAWLDHQWGDTNLSRDESGRRVVGWDWIGFNLDDSAPGSADGPSGVVMVQKDAAGREPLASLAALWPGEGGELTTGEFTLEPTRFWESPITRVRFPVAWRMEIPAFGAELFFEPLADMQELLFFDMTITMWEGAGRVRGTINGKPVSGRARGEFYGYGLVTDSGEYLDRFSDPIQAHLEEFLPRRADHERLSSLIGPAHWQHRPGAYNEAIADPVWDLIDRKGKSWRPVFVLLMLEAFGKSSKPYEALLSVPVELAHTGALIIDDVEDNSELRRGDQAIHLRYGTDVAINAGTTLFFLPTRLIDEHPLLSPEQKLALHKIAMDHSVRAHLGQAMDIHLSRSLDKEDLSRPERTSLLDQIREMYALKTGTAVVMVTEAAALIAGVEDDLREAALAFARDFGVAFQIADDVLNFSDSPKWRKTRGEDLREGKLTYVIHRALEMLEGPERERLARILRSPELRNEPAALREGIGLVQGSGALDRATREADDLFRKAWDRFADQVPPSWPKWMLYAVCSKLISLAKDV